MDLPRADIDGLLERAETAGAAIKARVRAAAPAPDERLQWLIWTKRTPG
jgi:hypothetical protein